jgi:transglutaminase/protease-like cytokinesis protein 3
MHFLRTVILVFVSLSSLFSQNYATVDAHARNSKAHRNLKVNELAFSLSAPCNTEKEKVRAFFVWIADNIRYDINTFQDRKEMDPEERAELQMPQQVIKRKKAVCMGYTKLLNELCNAVGIKAIFVGGQTKNHTGRISRTTHAWSLVRADGQWGLIDATWGSGSIDIES